MIKKSNKCLNEKRLALLLIIAVVFVGVFGLAVQQADAATIYGTTKAKNRIRFDYSTETSGNTTKITWKVYCEPVNSAVSWDAQTPLTVKIDGSTVCDKNVYWDVRNGKKLLASGTKNVTRSNGAAKSVKVTAKAVTGTSAGTLSLSGTINLAAYTTYKDVTAYVNMSDNSNQDGKRPSAVTVTLLQNGKAYKSTSVSITGNSQSAVFKSVPASNGGTVYSYTVQGAAVSGYSVSNSAMTTTYTHVPEKVSVQGGITWNDNNNRAEYRPDSVKVSLMKNGTVISTAATNASLQWKYSFASCDKYTGGKLNTYTVSTAESLSDYEVETDGSNLIFTVIEKYAYRIGFCI